VTFPGLIYALVQRLVLLGCMVQEPIWDIGLQTDTHAQIVNYV